MKKEGKDTFSGREDMSALSLGRRENDEIPVEGKLGLR